MDRPLTPKEAKARAAVSGSADALTAFEGTLSLLSDPRRAQGTRYPLRSVVLMALMATVCGNDDADAIADWGEDHKVWLATFLDLPHGTPSQDVILSVFQRLNPKEFGTVFVMWVAFLRERAVELRDPHIAIDGKTSRRTYSAETPAIHTVSAWLSEAGLVIGQTQTREKSNEISAIPELLRCLALKGTTVTIDAMGCQTAIAEAIVQQEGHYLLAVKDNQPTLHDEIHRAFEEMDSATTRPRDLPALPTMAQHEETTKDHGRIEHRKVQVIRNLTRMTQDTRQRWVGLVCIIRVIRERTVVSTGKTSNEVAYYIGSNPKADAQQLAHFIRSHWGIENSLHYVLDVAFHEDASRHRTKNLAANLTTLRHMATNLLRVESTCKLGIANKRKKAGRNRDYLMRVLSGKPAGSE
jgi:predicted transposase YbfD/YdcC